MFCFRLLRGHLWGVFDTPLQSDTYDPSKYRCNSPTGYVWPFKKLSRFYLLRGRLWGVCDTIPRSSTYDPLEYRCDPPTGYVRSFEIPMQFSDRVRAALQKTAPFSSPSGPIGGRIQYAPTTGYVQSFKIPMQSLDRRGRGVWEVGRWGLPLAGETGVNEFGEEEDDDQDYNNEGARGDLQHKRQP